MKIKTLLKPMLAVALLACAVPLQAQMVSNNNDDEVNRVDRNAGPAYRPGQVIVKFKNDSRVKAKRSTKGRLQSMGVNAVDNVMSRLGITEAIDLMPLTGAIKNRSPRRAKALSGRLVTEPDLSTLYCLKFDAESTVTVEDAVEQFKALAEVEYAEPNYLVFIQTTGTEDLLSYINEPMYSQQWGLNAIKLPQLWAKDKVETERPVIAILDTGVDVTHPDLKDNIWTNSSEATGASYEDDDNNGYVDDVHGWDFVAGTAIIGNGMDRNGHGTHCAGIAAAVGNNGIGITGANPDAYILPIKVMGDDGTGDIATICRGIDYATACHAHVLSMSFGTPRPSGAMYQALSKSLTNYAVLCGAAGNCARSIYDRVPDYLSGLSFPGAYDFVVGVMASNSDGSRANYSNFDPDGPFFSKDNMDKAFSQEVTWNDEAMWNYDVMAPGTGIMSTYLNGSYKALNGTSMATPMVAGAISRILQTKGYDYARDYGLIGDMAMAKNGGITDLAVFDAQKAANYDETNREVALALTALEIDDSEGDSDGRFDAGETINIYPTVRSLWGHAENIKISIEPYDENTPTDAIEVLDNNVDFGWSLNSRGSFKSQNPIRVKVNENANDGLHLPYKIIITCDNLLAGVEQEHVFEVENGVELGGVINEDMTLYPDKHYIVTKSIAIPQGKTLTIMPGTRLEFNENCYIQSDGKLIANGKPDSLIVFTSREPNKPWAGIRSHGSQNYSVDSNCSILYTNTDSTLFTVSSSDKTTIELQDFSSYVYMPHGYKSITIYSGNYMLNYLREKYPHYFVNNSQILINDKEGLLSDPNFISEPVLQALQAYRDSISKYPTTPNEKYTIKNFISFRSGYRHEETPGFLFVKDPNPCDTISFCIFEKFGYNSHQDIRLYLHDCIIHPADYAKQGLNARNLYLFSINGIEGCRNNIIQNEYETCYISNYRTDYKFYNINSNFVNLNNWDSSSGRWNYWTYKLHASNNIINVRKRTYKGNDFYLLGSDLGIFNDHADLPSWLGTSKEDIIRPYIYDSKNPNVDCFTTVDLSNMPTRPYREAHGIVWKVVVDGYDAQDEFDQLPPLGVGRHKFEVYYNRDDIDTTFTPSVSMGLREPYTQTPIAEGGYWTVKDSASVYTVFLNITGKTNCDGLNRIKVTGGKDHDHFDIPDEYWRFNVLVQAAGSMATGFAAEAGMGNVKLTWNNENNDFEDAMGFNVYRYNYIQVDSLDRYGRPTGVMITVADTIRLNEMILDLETTSFTDYEVTPGETYYYYYKVLSTDLKEYDISNVVSATPLTSTLGDANASGSVDVADVITTVNYAAGMEPRPFLYEAADVNADQDIDILDVIGIIKIITRPGDATTASIEGCAIYSVEDDVVYVDSPVDLAGVQLTLNADRDATITPTETLTGFEQVGAWMNDNNYLFLAYNMAGRTIEAGKHAILRIGDAEITDIRLSDRDGHNIMATPAEEVVTGIGVLKADVTSKKQGTYDMMGRRVTGTKHLQPGIYIVNGKKVVVK